MRAANSLWLLCITFFTSTSFIKAQIGLGDAYSLDQDTDSILNILSISSYYVDETNELTWEEVVDEQIQERFQAKGDIEFEGKYDRGKYDYWLKFKLKNENLDTIKYWFQYGKINNIKIHQIIEGQLASEYIGGKKVKVKYPTGAIPYQNKFLCPLILPPNTESLFLIRLRNKLAFNITDEPVLIPSHIVSEAQPFVWARYYGFFGALFGILGFLFLFNVLQYFQNKDRAFLYYSLYVLTMAVHFGRNFENNNPFLNPLPYWFIESQVYFFTATLPILFYFLFARAFLDTPTKMPRVDYHLRMLIMVISLLMITSPLFYYLDSWLAWKSFVFTKYVLVVYSIVLMIAMFEKGNKLSYYFFGGSFFLVLGGFLAHVFSLSDEMISGVWDYTNLVSYIGVLIELLFFGLGLGYKSRLLEQERNILSNQVLIKEEEAKQLAKLNHLKNNFFANISHEFRTPLTLILGMANNIKGQPTAKNLIKKNGEQLLNLINKILQLAKLEAQTDKLHLINGNIVEYLKYLTESFRSYTQSKQVDLSFYSHEAVIRMDFDVEKTQQIMTNLLSNAVKFTRPYGKIQVIVKKEEACTQLTIKDTGIGIPKAHLERIFDRFYQVDDTISRGQEGTGIGLSLVKELVKLMGGNIDVKSKVKEGTAFIIELPIHQNAPLVTTDSYKRVSPQLEYLISNGIQATFDHSIIDSGSEKPSILIVEDNHDVIRYLKMILKSNYQLKTAMNGKEGWELAKSEVPDLIISDVMMPEMNGIELSEILKEEEKTSHIPIILLTARAGLEDRIDGLKTGADAYLVKPFEPIELTTRIENLIDIRKKLRDKYSSMVKGDYLNRVSGEKLDKEQEFLMKLYSILEENYLDADFELPHLYKKLAMSQTQFYRKIKALTNTTPALLIRSFRLNKAKELLESTDWSIKKIALEVGIADIPYFSKSFKKEFGQAPSEYRK